MLHTTTQKSDTSGSAVWIFKLSMMSQTVLSESSVRPVDCWRLHYPQGNLASLDADYTQLPREPRKTLFLHSGDGGGRRRCVFPIVCLILENAFKEFLQLWHKHPPALKDEPVRLWWSVVKGQTHSDLTVDGVVTIYIQKVKGQVSYDVIMIRKKRSGQCSMPELGTSNLNGCTYAVVLPQNL